MNIIHKPFKYIYYNACTFLVILHVLFYFIGKMFPLILYYSALTPNLTIYKKMFWQIASYSFFHSPSHISHILLNMLSLLIFGIKIEQTIGSREFLLFYFLVGIISGALSTITYFFLGLGYISIIGASGIIFGLLFLYAVIFPQSVLFIWGIFPIPAPFFVLSCGILEILQILTNDGIAHAVHLFGIFAAWAYIRIRFNIKPLQIWNQ